ncbi:MAG: hypothetical protein V1716_04355 [Candidatus Uhrbacteria bacterium]
MLKEQKNKIIPFFLALAVLVLIFWLGLVLKEKNNQSQQIVSPQNFIFLANDEKNVWELYKILPDNEKIKTDFEVFYMDDESFEPTEFSISPNNKWIAYPVWDKGMNLRINIFRIESASGQTIFPTEESEVVFDGFNWSTDSQRVFYKELDKTGKEFNYQFDVITGQKSLIGDKENF